MPYALTLGILRTVMGLSDEGMDPAAIRVRLMTALGSAAPHVGAHMAQLLSLDLEPSEHEEVIGLAPDALRAAYIEGIGALLRSGIREPTVLVCEDVHWADEASVNDPLVLGELIDNPLPFQGREPTCSHHYCDSCTSCPYS